ncbi:lysophospholipid acyltransferase family protein [Virgibacillus salinus]|uniref:1-acyl-sn-glycerol-3-phosphate acyltransferase n=1 Tax=Virgibacillus salinus TaxID=553311 RepID=A0A1H0XUB4_9BACI|nr:lysophospholipid acyltransferase family protein [Virgibacillus salinus]SDQ06508.1 1-acyl-sn-glycerol-3-phosphate acyltransferase [Virgibacillus salinus]
MSIENKPNMWIINMLLIPIRFFTRNRSKIVIERNDTLHMEPPYIILSNHVNNWDPLILNSYVKEPISFIAADPLFRNPFLKRILNYVGAIPKMKFKNDTSTIRGVLKAKKHNRVIGIFPEGNRNWDGDTEPLIYSTAKLVKLLDIPVVVATIRGGHLTHPRWADKHRKGLISISYKKEWDQGAFSNDSPDVINQKLTEALYHNEMEWQSEIASEYQGKNLANYLERLLFVCPHCRIPGQLHSHDDLFECQSCDYTVRYTLLGNFEEVTHPIYYSTPRDWNKWQLEFLKETLLDPDWQQNWNEAMQDHVKLFISWDNEPFRLISKGDLKWNNKTITFNGDNQEQYAFAFRDLEGINIQFHHKLDFFYENQFYRIVFYQPNTSAYKWLMAIKTAQALESKQTKEVIS